MAPEPRLGFEMTLLRMLAFRPETAAAASAGGDLPRVPAAPRGARSAQRPAGAGSADAPVASVKAAGGAARRSRRRGAGHCSARQCRWRSVKFVADVVAAAELSGMARQFALNCVPASFENDVLTLRLDRSVAERRTRAIEEKLAAGVDQISRPRHPHRSSKSRTRSLATPARQRAVAEQDEAQRAAAAFEEDPAVKGLRERFGAEVDAASVKPAN